MTRADLVLRQVRPMGGALVDVAIANGRIAAVAPRLSVAGPEIDGGGHALLPGLHDHHIHLLATAARRGSVDLAGAGSEAEIVARLRAAPGEGWIRAVGYDEAVGGIPDAALLDRWRPDRPLRLQDRTGALWALNSAGLARLGGGPFPEGVETDPAGRPNGRIWRADAWLGERLEQAAPPLTELSAALARRGVTGVTDTGARNGPQEAAILGNAVASGDFRQHLTLMGREDLPKSDTYVRGPLKLLYDDHDLPPVDIAAARIAAAREQGRKVAAHCVTVAELALFLASLDAAGGAEPGDRIEHGGLIPASFIPAIAERGLTVVSQPHFIAERGDRYRRDVPPDEWNDLYRLAALSRAGIPLAAGSDAPYGDIDPWRSIPAAIARCTADGVTIGTGERLAPASALALWLGDPADPGGPPRRIDAGAVADLCLLDRSLPEALADPADVMVMATVIAGRPV